MQTVAPICKIHKMICSLDPLRYNRMSGTLPRIRLTGSTMVQGFVGTYNTRAPELCCIGPVADGRLKSDVGA